MPIGDSELLLATSRGDDAAARELWGRFGARLLAYAAAVLKKHGGAVAAQDVVQSVFCGILELDTRSIACVNDAASWLLRAVRNASLNHIRSVDRAAALRAARGLSSRDQSVASISPSADPSTFYPQGSLRRAVESLDDELRELILLKHLAALTFDQIALCLDQNRNTIVSRYRKAIDSLRKYMSQEPVAVHEHESDSTEASPAVVSLARDQRLSEEST